jgi:hypothetical protein
VIASAALRRPQPTLMGFRDPSGTRARAPRVAMGSTQPVRRSSRPAGIPRTHRPTGRSPRAAPLGLPPPTELVTGTPRRPAGFPACRTTLPLMDFLRPTTQSQAGGPVIDGGSLRRRVPRTGFDYPLRDIHHRPSRRLRAGASMGFTLQGFLLVRDRYPSRGPCPPDVTACIPASPGGSQAQPAGFRAFFSRRVRAVTGIRRSRPSIPSWGSSFQSLLPLDPTLAFVAASPLSPFGGLTSRPAWAPGYRGANESVGPSPDLQLS